MTVAVLKAEKGVSIVPPIPAALRAEMAPYLKTRAQRFLGWHPVARRILVSAPDANATQLFVIDQPMGAARQLTFGPEPVKEAEFEPETGRQILLLRDVVGVRGSQVFRIYTKAIKPVPVLLSDGRRPYSFPRWAPNGQQVAYLSRSPGADGLGLGILNPLAPQTARRLAPLNNGNWTIEHWASNSAMLLLREVVSDNESYLYLADAGIGKLSVITPRGSPKAAHGLARFAPDLSAVFFTSDVDGEFQQFSRLDLRTGLSEVLLPELKWNVEALAISPSGKQAALIINESGFGQLRLLGLETAKAKLSVPPKLPRGRVQDLRWRSDGTKLGFSVSAPDSAGDVFSMDTLNGQITRWTRRVSNSHSLPSIGVVRSFDGEKVPLVYWLPNARRFAEPARRPVLLMLPSSPGSQMRPGHLGPHGYLLEKLGMAIVCPNLRGVRGYGNRHRSLDDGRLRSNTLRDLNAVLNWIRQQPQLDGERVALWGEGYGGSLALLAMSSFNSFIRCGVVIGPVANWGEHVRGAPSWEKTHLRAEFGDERDGKIREFLDRVSPLDSAGNNLDAIPTSSPILLLGQCGQLRGVLNAKKKTAWVLPSADLTETAKRERWFLAAALFLKKNLY